MATLAQLEAALRKADAAGATEDARVLAAEVRKMRAAHRASEAPAEKYDPTEGSSFAQNAIEGVGRGMTSAIRALGGGSLLEKVGLPGSKEEAERLDAPLMNTAGGQVGNAVGIAAPAALAIPFTPATIAGATVAGGVTGAALTEGSVGDRVLGGAAGAAGGAAGAALPYVYRAGKGFVKGVAEPLTQAGRERIAGRAIERFATNPIQNLTSAPTQTGARLTLAEATQDPGLATLQRAIATADPEAAALLAARQEANNAARIESLRVLAGGSQQPASRVGRLNRIATGQPTREAAEAARSGAAATSYRDAFEAGIDPQVAEAMAPQVQALMERPSVQAGMAQARRMAAEEGINLTDGGSVQGLHYLKMALDDMAGRLREQPTKQRLVLQTAKDLSSVLDELSPAYQVARREFQLNSVPVNRAAVGERLLEKTTGAIRDFSGNRKLQANAFSRALNDEGELLQKATGFRGAPDSLDDLLTATQSGRVNAVRNELETLANLNNAANGPGSQTAKMLASQNLLQQIAGPLGMPQSMMDSVLSQTLLRPVQFGFKAAEPRIGAAIADAALDPEQANRLIQAARAYDAVRGPNAFERLLRRSAPAAIGAGSANAAGQ